MLDIRKYAFTISIQAAYLATSRTNGANELFKTLQQLPFREKEDITKLQPSILNALVSYVIIRSSSHLL